MGKKEVWPSHINTERTACSKSATGDVNAVLENPPCHEQPVVVRIVGAPRKVVHCGSRVAEKFMAKAELSDGHFVTRGVPVALGPASILVRFSSKTRIRSRYA